MFLCDCVAAHYGNADIQRSLSMFEEKKKKEKKVVNPFVTIHLS